MTETKNFHFEAFSSLDSSKEADFLIESMDVMYSLESIRQIKQRAIAALNLQPGESVLEAGCGHGEDAAHMGQLVGDNGYVLAIDNSKRMLIEAMKRSHGKNIEYRLDEVQAISCKDDFFSACHADRLLVGHPDFEAIFQELLRVLKPKGRISITDVDALSIVIHPHNKTTEAILKELKSRFVNPSMGRMLLPLFHKNHLQDIQLFPEISTIRSYETLRKIFKFDDIIAQAIKNGKITPIEAENWQREIHEADQKNDFLYAIMFFTVVGSKP